MKQGDIRLSIGGVNVDYPLEAFDLKVKSFFENDNIQPDIDVEDLTIYGDGVKIVNNHIAAGLYFKGLPLILSVYNQNDVRSVFNGYVNLPKKHEIFQDGTLKIGISKKDSLTSLNDRLSSITWDMLESKGKIGNSDYTSLEYVVEKSDNAIEILISTLILFIMVKELLESINSLAKNVAEVIGASVPTVPFVSLTIGQIIKSVIFIILQILYIAFILIAIINMSTRLFELLIAPKRTHKLLKYRRGMEILANYLGYTFSSPITELDNYHYLPSNNNVDGIDLLIGTINVVGSVEKGYPKASDYGYTAIEFVTILMTQFEAKLAIVGNQLILRAKNDPYWLQNATYTIPDVDIESYGNNADELVFSKLLKYETDVIADEYTLSNFKGTNYQILVNDPALVQGSDDNFIKKHETVSFYLALGTRKDKLTAIESSLAYLAGIIDMITSTFGGGTSWANQIKNRVGTLKVGTNNHTKAKCIYLVSGIIPTNHRDFTSAKYLYNKYINHGSFVLNGFGQQKNKYKIDAPFGMTDFLETSENSYATHLGNQVKITFSEWQILNDVAALEFEKKHVYAPNLFETYIEQN